MIIRAAFEVALVILVIGVLIILAAAPWWS